MIRTTTAAALLATLAGASAQGQTASAAPVPIMDDFPGTYDDAYVFARIIRHEVPAARVYEDVDTLAFMSLGPNAPGHVLVISKTARARSLIALPPEALARIMAVARRVVVAQRRALGAAGALILASNGSIQAVPHFHLHVIPTRPGDRAATLLATEAKPPPAELEAIAAKLAAAMPPA